jgi:hypothetical protein
MQTDEFLDVLPSIPVEEIAVAFIHPSTEIIDPG